MANFIRKYNDAGGIIPVLIRRAYNSVLTIVIDLTMARRVLRAAHLVRNRSLFVVRFSTVPFGAAGLSS